ncbi:MAG: biotin transporter BioY [Candidatus Omnitrophota bacterium]
MEALLKKEIVVNKTICRLIGVAGFIVLTGLGAFVRVPLPFTPVPLTLQTFFVLLSGAFLGGRLGALTQLSYLFLGATGLSLFSGVASGPYYLLGPTGGYLLGFVIAAFFLGKALKHSSQSFLLTFAMFCAADVMLLSCGVLWLKVLTGLSFAKLMLIGFVPFIAGDLVKAAVAASLYKKLKTRIENIF